MLGKTGSVLSKIKYKPTAFKIFIKNFGYIVLNFMQRRRIFLSKRFFGILEENFGRKINYIFSKYRSQKKLCY